MGVTETKPFLYFAALRMHIHTNKFAYPYLGKYFVFLYYKTLLDFKAALRSQRAHPANACRNPPL